MGMTKRYLMTAAAAAVVALAAGAFAAFNQEEKDKGDRGSGDKAASALQGKITRVDADKRSIVLSEVKGGTGGTGTGTNPGDKDKGTGTGDKGTGDKGQEMTLMVAENAQISVDGKKAELRELRPGYFARVSIRQGDKGTGTGTGDKDRAPAPGTGAAREP